MISKNDSNTDQGLVAVRSLSEDDRAAVVRLAELCNRYEGLDLALNFQPSPADDTTDQFLYYDRGALVGFVSLYGDLEIEVCGMVHPERRRRGIGRALLGAAQAECRRRGLTSFLLVCEEASSSGKAFVAAVGAQYRYSEYRMELDAARINRPAARDERFRLRRAGPEDLELLSHLTAASFGDPVEEVRRHFAQRFQEPNQRFYIAALQDEPVGSLRLAQFDRCVYINAVGVPPAYRGRGYGRRMLVETIDMLVAEGWEQIMIEVVTENRNALSLYRSCGFKETTTYGFYEIGG